MFRFKKLILSIFTLGLTVVTLTTSTYAWFARNNEAWTDEFDLNIQTLDSLVVSIDGENYYSAISSDLIKQAVVSKITDTPVSDLTSDVVSTEYDKVKLETVTTNSEGSLQQFYSVDPNMYDDEGYYELQTASKYSYFSFDLYFRVISTGHSANKSYMLSFNNVEDPDNQTLKTRFTARNSRVTLWNNLVSKDREYQANDEFTTNAANAMRLGFLDSNSRSTIFEPTDTDTYSIDHGSYPIEGETDEIYDPAKNAMLTYSNNINKHKLKPIASDSLKYTSKSFGGRSLATFIPGTEYEDIKLSFYIWLEGYDADYIPGMDISSIKTFLSFRIDEVDV